MNFSLFMAWFGVFVDNPYRLVWITVFIQLLQCFSNIKNTRFFLNIVIFFFKKKVLHTFAASSFGITLSHLNLLSLFYFYNFHCKVYNIFIRIVSSPLIYLLHLLHQWSNPVLITFLNWVFCVVLFQLRCLWFITFIIL